MTSADDDRRDELASALLDGDLPDEEAAAARRDPAVVARVAELAAARERLRDVPPPPAAAREAGLAAALAAFDEPSRPTQLAVARRDRRRVPAWLGAAATVAVVAGVFGVLAVAAGLGGSSSSDSGTATAGDALVAEAPEASGEAGADAQDSGAAVVVDLGDLGDFPTEQALAARVGGTVTEFSDLPQRDSAEQPGAAASPTSTTGFGAASGTTVAPGVGDAESGAPPGAVALPGAGATCRGDDLPEAPVGGQSGVLAHAAARLAGTHVDVWLVRTADGIRMVALDTSCHAVADAPVA